MGTGITWKVVACCLSVGGMIVSDAHAHSSPSARRAHTAYLIQEVFERFFFRSWLGEAMSLAGSGGCPEAQVLGALGQKDRFPETFRRPAPDPRLSSNYCGAITIEIERPQSLRFVLRAPKADTCEDYVRQWQTFVSSLTMAGAIKDYLVSDETYDRYGIETQSRSIYRDVSAPIYPFNEISVEQTLISIRRFRLVSRREVDSMCHFEFLHEKASGGPKI